MYAAAAGDVYNIEDVEESGALPKPVGGHAVHDGVHQREEAVRVEVAPVHIIMNRLNKRFENLR